MFKRSQSILLGAISVLTKLNDEIATGTFSYEFLSTKPHLLTSLSVRASERAGGRLLL